MDRAHNTLVVAAVAALGLTGARSAAKFRLRSPRQPGIGFDLALLLVTCVVSTSVAAAPPLSAEQLATARHVEEQLMAPCCFSSSIAAHRSPIADEIRADIQARAARGDTEQEILDAYLERYGERILAQPMMRGFNLLAYWVPVAGLLCGAGIVVRWLHHRRRAAGSEDSSSASVEHAPNSTRSRHQDRLEKELAAFDDTR